MANSKYGSYGNDSTTTSGSSDDGDRERDLTLKWKPYATFRGVLDSVYGSSSQWGQAIGIKFTDGKLVDGVVMERLDDEGEPDGTIKLFPWESMPVVLGDDLEASDAPEVHTEEFVGDTYRYRLLGARIEENEDPAEPIELGNFMVWESGSKKPSATAKVLAQLFTEAGPDAIVDREDINNWLDTDNIEPRADLLGRELDVFKVEKPGDEYDFHAPVVIDTKLDEQIIVSSRVESDNATEAAAETEDDPSPSDDDESAEEDAGAAEFPEPVQDFVEFCTDFGLDDETQILDNLNDMAGDDGNSLSQDMVDEAGEDAILASILG